MRTPITRALAAVAALLATFFLGLSTASAAAPAARTAPTSLSYAVPFSIAALPSCELSSLPAEASETLDLIHSGGPFPHEQDGTVFQNREGILPDESTGYYHEYTVETPGSPDRGARRLVGGGETTDPENLYYTDDHYASFCEVDTAA
ncbi:ribonuclease T1 [Kribbella amoyensis]|uniref:Ribonuclease T1 n=1 Tax=Kribbella amoyensis TaxID=996641 RepID=A0A561BKR6_9ACTN|nr:ribonuclease domain-containing protein [Kribbella amoyensis]TWD79352.1 ribonuclease T1 [Kribbella amoyensis]